MRRSPGFPPLFFVSVLLVVGVAATYVTVEFATYLGFNLPLELLYPSAAIILACSFLAVRKLNLIRRILESTLRRLHLNGLVGVVVLSLAVRLIYVQYASVFPDEYSVFKILDAGPLANLPSFLTDYEAVHPPLSFILMSIGYTLLPTPVGARMISVAFSLSTVVVVYFIIVELGRREYALLGAAVYGLIPHTVLFLSSALTDVYMNFFGLVAILLYLKALRGDAVRNAVLSGVALGLSFWSKQGLAGFWAIMITILTLAPERRRGLVRGILALSLALAASAAVYMSWSLINASAFATANAFWWEYLLHPKELISWNIFPRPSTTVVQTSTTVVQTSTTVVQTSTANPFGLIFPKLSESRFGYVSYVELIAQMPLWLTPLVFLLSLWAVVMVVKRRDRHDFLLFVWVIIPLIAMALGIRDVRYLLLLLVPVAYFGALGTKVRSSELRRYLISLMFAFMVIFLIIALFVAQQQYSGVAEAGYELHTLGLDASPILSNAIQIQYYVRGATVYYLAPGYNASTLLRVVAQEGIRAVIIVQNARAAWPPVADTVRDALRLEFHRYTSGGISAFSWYEIYY